MPQYHTSAADAIYDYKQSMPPAYQENSPLLYSHTGFPHYHRSSVQFSGGCDFGYDYNQQYYPYGKTNQNLSVYIHSIGVFALTGRVKLKQFE